jgi:2-keto-3-deoxy-6-phosphogluconate aldolase
VAAGTVTGPSNNSASVTFPAGRFSVTPILTAVVASNPNNNVAVVYFGAITSTGFSVSAYTIGGAQIAATFHWQAIQMTSGAAAG